MMCSVDAPLYIHHIAKAVPRQSLTRDELLVRVRAKITDSRMAGLMQRFIRSSGIDKRHLAALDHQDLDDDAQCLYQSSDRQSEGPGMTVRTRAFEASCDPLIADVLREFGEPCIRKMTTLVTCTCTHAGSPGLERSVYRHCPLDRRADRWHLGFMGCSAALSGLRCLWRRSAGAGDGLLLACELPSFHLQYTHNITENVANALFADGVAAAHVSHEPSPTRIVACQGLALAAEADQMLWFAADNGFRLDLSPQLPETLGRHLPGAVAEFLAEHGLKRREIAHWAVHPGGPRILETVGNGLELSDAQLSHSRWVLRNFGNMSSPTVLFILERLIASRAEGPAVALAFGPGLTIEMALLELNST